MIIDGVELTLCVVCPLFESKTNQCFQDDPRGICKYSVVINGKRWCLI